MKEQQVLIIAVIHGKRQLENIEDRFIPWQSHREMCIFHFPIKRDATGTLPFMICREGEALLCQMQAYLFARYIRCFL